MLTCGDFLGSMSLGNSTQPASCSSSYTRTLNSQITWGIVIILCYYYYYYYYYHHYHNCYTSSGKQNNKDRSNYAQSEDDLDDPFYSIGHSHLSTSTPDIFRDTEEESRSSSMGRGRHPVSANINVKTKTLPQPPSKTMSFQEDVSWVSIY